MAGIGLLLSCAACFAPEHGDGLVADADVLTLPVELFRREAGLPAAPADADTVVCPPPSTLTRLTFSVQTAPLGGRFMPKNVGAIWIEDAGRTFVRTLKLWGQVRAKWLTAWLEASGGDTTDAITGATLLGHSAAHVVTWDLRDRAGCEVPHGPYVLRIELTDRSGTGVSLDIPFTKDGTRVLIEPDDVETFRDMQLTVE